MTKSGQSINKIPEKDLNKNKSNSEITQLNEGRTIQKSKISIPKETSTKKGTVTKKK